jgi:threonyl-tRNA synthetase
MKIQLDIDGVKPLDIHKGATPLEIIKDLQIQGNKRPLVAKFNGSLIDLTSPLEQEGTLRLLTFDDEEGRQVYWHSTSHIMAQAVLRLFPGTKLAIGPSISDGFYYDFYTENTFTVDDLERIEKEMKTIIKEDLPFERVVQSKKDACSFFEKSESTFKLELLNDIEGAVSLYRSGDFVDLCRGPHVPKAGYIKAFKLLSVSGSYWRGDENNESLQRIYGISFEDKKELKEYLHKLKEARERDHRKLGRELDLFSISERAGSGFILWHPKGATLRRIIEDFWKEEHIHNGYQLVTTPHIAKAELWKTSGHYDYYRENMYTFHKDDEEFVVKPMNCPGHILIYQSKMHSYRDLPVRYAEMGTVVRDELSGVLQGMLRTREFTIDDGHIFCTREQMDDEILGVLRFARRMAETFGFEKLSYELSVREPSCADKYAGCDEDWERAERSLLNALEKEKLEYKRMEGEAVFYGPKIDIKVLDALGRPWQGPTIQFDFNLPGRFNVSYIGKDGDPHHVFIVHRTVFGSLERFIGCLIEHYKGNFPLWLAPVQVRVMTITDKSLEYAEKVTETLSSNGIRVELDRRNEKINLKVREAEKEKVPFMAIVGEREEQEQMISIRERHRKNRGSMTVESFLNELHEKCDNRTLS